MKALVERQGLLLDKIHFFKQNDGNFKVDQNYDGTLKWDRFSFCANRHTVIADSDLEIDMTDRQSVCITGVSGCGKSLLLKSLQPIALV